MNLFERYEAKAVVDVVDDVITEGSNTKKSEEVLEEVAISHVWQTMTTIHSPSLFVKRAHAS